MAALAPTECDRPESDHDQAAFSGRLVPRFAPTGPDVLAVAAHLLPIVIAPCRLASCDVYTVVQQSIERLAMGSDRAHRLVLTDEAVALFAAYLVMAGEAVEECSPHRTVEGWVIFETGFETIAVQRALVAAARYWRRQLDPSLVRPATLQRWWA
jgi:hypothetical protein